ncbi:hypothetical protein ACQJBY_040104 [Aegilops geniculata]
MAYAVPPGDDDDLLNVLRLPVRQLPTWVSRDDLYRDLPHAVAGDSVQSTDGAGRPAYYVLMPLRAMGSRTRRTVGEGFWKVEKTIALLPSADEATSSKPAPQGTCAKLSFISRQPGGPEGRNGWLMKQYLLPHAPGAPAGPALCKLYFKKSAAAATTSTAAATTAAGKAAAAARPMRLPASAPSPKVFLKKPAAEAPSTAAPPAAKAATSQGARPLRVPASVTCASRLRLPVPKIFTKKPAAPTAAKAAAAPSLRPTSWVARPLRVPANTPCASRLRPRASTPYPKVSLKKPAAEAPPAAAPAPAKVAAAPSSPETSQLFTSGPPLRRQLSPPPPHLGTTPGRRWVLVETEATSPPPQPHHDRILKRIYKLLEVEEVDVEEGEFVEQGRYLRKKGRFCCHKSSYLVLKDDFRKLSS